VPDNAALLADLLEQQLRQAMRAARERLAAKELQHAEHE